MYHVLILCLMLGVLQEVELRTTTSITHPTEISVQQCNISSNVTGKLERIGSSRYYFSDENERFNWHEARTWCSRHGLQLVSVESEVEHRQLTAHVKARGWHDYWLGGTDAGNEGRWTWVTGNHFTFTAWRPGQPDNQFGIQNCLEMMHDDLFPGDNWWDRECQYIQRFACETSCPDE